MAFFRGAQIRSGPVVDIDLLPGLLPARRPGWQEFLGREPQWLGVGVAAVLLLLLVPARMQMTDEKADALDRLDLAQRRAAINLPREVKDLRTKLDAARKEAEGIPQVQAQIARQQRPWNDLFARTGSLVSGGARVRSYALESDGKTVTVGGEAPNQASILTYADTLRNSGTYTAVEVRSMTQGAQGQPARPGAGAVSFTISAVLADPAQGSAPGRAAASTFFGRDYVLAARQRIVKESGGDPRHVIRGNVVDRNGNPVSGLTFRASTCCPEWSAYYPGPFDPVSPGSFEFLVTDGKFVVEVVDPNGALADRAAELDTMGVSPGQHFEWDLAFLSVAEAPQSAGGQR